MTQPKQYYVERAALRYAIRRFLRVSEKNSRIAGITPQQYQLFLIIKGMEGRDWATISEIAERLQILHHAAVGLCTRAEQLGFITRIHHPEDRRQVCIYLTEEGEKALMKVAVENQSEIERLCQEIANAYLAKETISKS